MFAGAVAPFNFARWIDEHAHLLKPPVGNKLVYEEPGMVVQVVGGPNQRVDFHDDPVQEFFYQLRGDIILKVEEGGRIIDIPIRAGEVFLLPPHVPHSPQRPIPGSVGLVVEGTRRAGDIDAFQWYCFGCGLRVHRVELSIQNIVTDLPPLYEAFYADEAARTCRNCGSVHPGKEPPPGWVASLGGAGRAVTLPDAAGTLRFADIAAATPTRQSLNQAYAEIEALLEEGGESRTRALARWDRLRRDYDSWSALVNLRFAQNTTDGEAKAAREYADALAPEATGHEVRIKRRLLADPDRPGLEKQAGSHAVRLWETDVTTFDPVIASDLEEESRLTARYTELLASAAIVIEGRTVNLAGLAPYCEHLDRDIRHRAEQARWAFFDSHGDTLDQLYDALVRLRHGMARKLGYETYTPLAYRRLRRVDYNAADVAVYRDQVAQEVVPLIALELEQRRRRQGWDRLRFWDEALVDPAGNPAPVGDHDELLARAQTMFDCMDGRLGRFYRLMHEGGFLDLRNRPGKAGGGFCTSFPTVGVPFIFANFNGTHQDVGVFTHEMGHAFQNWQSREQPSIDYLWPTMEAAEINSMGLEFLTYPHMGLLVGDAAAGRFRRMHLLSSLAFLPYGVCVDHFQHEVYAHPDATPAERHAMWQRLERRYLPWADYGDLAYPAKGGRWQAKQHIFTSPFYYIDYTLALCCALQLWALSRKDYGSSLEAYVALCGRGGSAPFQELVRSAGLASPFRPGALSSIVGEAEAALAGAQRL